MCPNCDWKHDQTICKHVLTFCCFFLTKESEEKSKQVSLKESSVLLLEDFSILYAHILFTLSWFCHENITSSWGCTCEKFGCLPLHPNNKWKAEQTRKSAALWKSLRGVRMHSKPLPVSLERWSLQRETSLGPSTGVGNLAWIWQLAGRSVGVSLKNNNSRGPSCWRRVPHFVRFTSRHWIGFSQ